MFGKKKENMSEVAFTPVIYNNGLKKAIAFIDYESWYVSMNVNFSVKPDIRGWFEDISSKYNLTEAIFFADFSHKSLADEIKRIRPYSNKIIDTRSPNGVKKDFTDFIILDNIYQKAMMSEGINTFILFTGDGHFSSAVSFLKNICKKEVGIYGVEGSFSQQLKDISSWNVTLPTKEQLMGNDCSLIFGELQNAKTMFTPDELTKAIISKNKKIKKESISKLLEKLKKEHIVVTRNVGTKKNILFVDWDKAKADGYIETEEKQ